jgi:hypothetical protein
VEVDKEDGAESGSAFALFSSVRHLYDRAGSININLCQKRIGFGPLKITSLKLVVIGIQMAFKIFGF